MKTYLKRYLSPEIWLNYEGWKFIAINLIGNLFPVWFLVIINFSNDGVTWEGFIYTLSQPYTYLILSVTYGATTLYLWLKKIKSENIENNGNNKVSVAFIIYVIILFPVIGFFLSKKNCLEILGCTCSPIFPVIYWVIFPIVVLVYIYHQLRDFTELEKIKQKSSTNLFQTVNNEINELNQKL